MKPDMRLIPSLLALALLASGCEDPQLKAQEQELAAAGQQLAELKARHGKLLAEKQQLEARVKEATDKARAAQAEHQRALAAAAWLSPVAPAALPLDEEMRQARLGFELKQALRAHNTAALNTLLTEATRPSWPCASASEAEETDAEETGCCEPPADQCAGVPLERPVVPQWSCQLLRYEKAPAAAFCTASAEYEPESAMAEGSIATTRTLVRTAFFHEGRLHVSDGDTSAAVFTTANTYARERCALDNQGYACEYTCEKATRTGRCACLLESEGPREETEHKDECECVTDEPTYALSAARFTETTTLDSSPAPGVFVVKAEQTRPEGQFQRLRILQHPLLVQLVEKGGRLEGTKAAAYTDLEEADSFDITQPSSGEGEAAPEPRGYFWLSHPESGHKVLVAYTGYTFTAWSFNATPKAGERVIEEADATTVCPLLRKLPPTDMPAALVERCQKDGTEEKP
jgi:hypothetical protein